MQKSSIKFHEFALDRELRFEPYAGRVRYYKIEMSDIVEWSRTIRNKIHPEISVECLSTNTGVVSLFRSNATYRIALASHHRGVSSRRSLPAARHAAIACWMANVYVVYIRLPSSLLNMSCTYTWPNHDAID